MKYSIQILSTEPDGATHSNFNYPSIRLSPLTWLAAYTLPNSPSSPLTPFSGFCTECSSVLSLIASICMLWASPLSHALMPWAGNLKMNETQFLCSPGFYSKWPESQGPALVM